MKAISVSNAAYIEGLKPEVVFNDYKKLVVDFSKFLKTHSHPQYNKYKKLENFKKFKIEKDYHARLRFQFETL
jgi:hypothetical protein